MPMSPGLAAFKLAFQLSPIFLTGGIAKFIPGNVAPIVLFTEALNLPLGLLSGGENIELDDFFAHYVPIPGGTIIDQVIAEYPFANQGVAANAIIQQPLNIALRMICPARNTLGYAAKLATMLGLEGVLKQHNAQGGTYTIATPSFFYTNCVMLAMRDITPGNTAQAQAQWQLEFRKPLLTSEAAAAAQNSLMSKLTAGTQINGEPTWSGQSINVGQPTPNLPTVTNSPLPAVQTPPPAAVATPASVPTFSSAPGSAF